MYSTNDLQNLGRSIANGNNSFNSLSMAHIADNLNFQKVRPEFYPGAALSSSSPSKRSLACLKFVDALWGIGDELKDKEIEWLEKMRKVSGAKSKNDEKDSDLDLVSPEILTRALSLAFLHYEYRTGLKKYKNHNDFVFTSKIAIEGLQGFVKVACLKGWSRQTVITVDDKEINLYNFLIQSGIPVGGSGKFLPVPDESLPYLFGYLRSETFRSEVFI